MSVLGDDIGKAHNILNSFIMLIKIKILVLAQILF